MAIQTYYLQDASNSTGTGGQVSPDFNVTASTAAACLAGAQGVAQQFATLFQRNVVLVQRYPQGTLGPPWTPTYTANATSLALSTAPSGISSP